MTWVKNIIVHYHSPAIVYFGYVGIRPAFTLFDYVNSDTGELVFPLRNVEHVKLPRTKLILKV